MEIWEVQAREAIRDLVARYNANGDTARFPQVLELFADTAVMTLEDGVYSGKEEILTIFTGAKETVGSSEETNAGPAYIRHHTSTHQIDLLDETHANGRLYFQVLSPVGLDHWGRYVDRYECIEGRWLFTSRNVTVDGQVANSLFPATGK